MSEKDFVTHDSLVQNYVENMENYNTKKAIRDVLLLKQVLTNEKHDKRKLYTVLTEFIPFYDEKIETIDYGPSREVS